MAQYLAVGTDGSLFISDSSYGCVRWYTPDLKERFIFGRGLLSKPTGIAVRNNILIVSDFATGSLVEFTISALNEVGSELSREKSQGS